MTQPTIGVIGVGHMGQCLVAGLLADNYPARHLILNDHHTDTLKTFEHNDGVLITSQKQEVIERSDVVILATKPQHLANTCAEIKTFVRAKPPLIISIAAGITTQQLLHWLKADLSVIRAMPNTPALLKCGATALYTASTTAMAHREWAEMIMRAVGTVVWIEREPLMDVVTALSGSGPAYFFWLMELMQAAAVDMGLAPEMAELLTRQTALGAAKMAMSSDTDVATLKAQVTSPGGTTATALECLNQVEAKKLIFDTLKAAKDRANQISKEFS